MTLTSLKVLSVFSLPCSTGAMEKIENKNSGWIISGFYLYFETLYLGYELFWFFQNAVHCKNLNRGPLENQLSCRATLLKYVK